MCDGALGCCLVGRAVCNGHNLNAVLWLCMLEYCAMAVCLHTVSLIVCCRLGHTVFTSAPVFMAEVSTDRGPIVRIYEFDREMNTTYQVQSLHGVVECTAMEAD